MRLGNYVYKVSADLALHGVAPPLEADCRCVAFTEVYCSSSRCVVCQVAWLDGDSVPVTYDLQTMIDDARFSVVRQAEREWNLQIRDVTWSDATSGV